MPLALTTVSAANLCDSSGNTIDDATIWFQPVTSDGDPTSYKIGGGGQVMSGPVSAQVVDGAFSTLLADALKTTPVIGYFVTVLDNQTGASLLGPGYECVQPTGATWSFDDYVPNLAPNVTVQYGPPGQGFNVRGAWLQGVQYQPYDVVFYGGSSYVLLEPLAPAVAFDPGAWELLVGGALAEVVLIGVDDGLPYAITVKAGAVSVTQLAAGSVSGATSLPFIDAATALPVQLFVSSGNVQVIPATASLPAPAVFVDASSGQHYALSESGGDLDVTPVSSGLAGVASIVFIDQVTGASYSLSMTGGSPSFTALSGNVAGISFLYFVDPITQRTFSLSMVSGNGTVTAL